jgi:hypothetical protein
MSKMIVLGAAALSLSFALPASAQQYAPAPIPFRMLSDPAYLPVQNQWFGSSAFSISESDGDVYNAAGDKTATRKGWEDEITQVLEYGITNDIAVRIADTYVPYDKTKNEFTGGGFADNDRNGFADPSAGLTWRAMDQANSNSMNLDLIGDYKTNLISANTGNVARGGEGGDFGLAVSRVMPNFTIYGQALAEWYGDSSELDTSNKNFTRTGSYWDYLLNLQTQTRLGDRFSVNAGAGYVFANNARVADLTSGVDHTTQIGDGWRLNAALNYLVQPNIVASLTYDYARDDTTSDIYALPASDTSLRNHDDNRFGVKFAYQTP